jgi:hypothetical protein
MSISTRDEGIHPQGTDKYWNESFYLNFFDDRGEWGGVTRVGLSPNQSQTDGLLCLYFPDGGVGVMHGVTPRATHVDEIVGGDLRHDRIEPLRRWRVQYKGSLYRFENAAEITEHMLTNRLDAPQSDVEIDLEFTGYHEPFDYELRQRPLPLRTTLRNSGPRELLRGMRNLPLKLRQGLKMRGARHYEQAGSVVGTIKVDGETTDFTGSGQRDHSWGVRDWKVATRWRWFVCQFGEEMAFNAARVELLGFQAVGGYVWHKGKCSGLASWDLKNTFDESGVGGKHLELTLRTESGETFDVSGDVMVNIPLKNEEGRFVTMVNEGRARFQWQGHTGYGVSEFLEQLKA